MRRLLIGATMLALVWSGWWTIGAIAIDRALANWQAARAAEGWQVSFTGPDVSGFPLTWASDIANISVIAPLGSGQATADATTVRLAATWPFAAEIVLPDAPVVLTTSQTELTTRINEGLVTLALNPGLSPTLKAFGVHSSAWQLNTPQGNLASAESLDIDLVQAPDAADRYSLNADIIAMTPGDVLRAMLDLPRDWPRKMEVAHLDLAIALDPEVASSETSSAKLRELEVRRLDLGWNTVLITARGDLSIDALGTPDGVLNLLVTNWRRLYEVLKSNGTIAPGDQFQTDLMLNALANIGGDPETLDLTIQFENGNMTLGHIPLGPAPKILF